MSLAAVEALVRERIGLDPASLGAATLPRVVAGRLRVRGLASADGYARLLTSDSTEWGALVAELVVPETWFFRGGRAYFVHLARWARERPRGRPVRVLSVPCSTGEEPYSLAVALDEAGVPPTAFRIDGVDLSTDHLKRAATGRYTDFAFREAGPDPRPRYFQEVSGGKWELLPRVREAVRFRPGNLVEDGFLAGEAPYDLILCRNLFIYLTDPARARALANLDRLLAADGRLCLTPAEADRLPADRFVADGPAALAVFRRAGVAHDLKRTPVGRVEEALRRGPTPTANDPTGASRHRAAPAVGVGPRRLDPTYEGASPTASAQSPSPSPHDPVQAVRELADAGHLTDARTACERALAGTPTASLFSLLGVIHLAAGRPGDAAAAFRKALYLDPDHPEALTHMIVVCEQRGDPGQAAGLRRRLARVEREARA
jgi:chemotaxis protein methyltransferase WspC